MNPKKPLLMAMLASSSLLAVNADAAAYTEVGDAGQTPATVQGTGPSAGLPLPSISGNLALSGTDADLYAFQITAASTFSATTVNAATNIDTALFLFTSSGVAIATDDDAAGGASVGSTLAAGNSLYATLAPGTYYLGISLSGNEPANSASQLLFAGYPGGDSTATRGAATGVNPTTLSTFNGNFSSAETTTAYRIDLTSAATAVVPEPSTVSLLVGAGTALAAFLRRKRNS